MKRMFIWVMALVMLPVMALADVVELPIDFSPGLPVQGDYPAKRGSEEMTHYSDPSIEATYEKVKSDEWQITYYMARIKVANATQIRTAAADSFDKVAVAPTQTIARRMNAVVAINGDFYIGRSGRYVLRQGQVFRDGMEENQDVLLIDEDGDFHIILADEHPENMDKTTIDGKKVINAFCFGPALIRDGEIAVNIDAAQPVSKPKDGEQRIAICQTGPLEYMVITVAHWGMTVENFANFLYSFGDVQQAYNLDGGNSCHLVFMGHWRNVINSTNANRDYRTVPDIIYFASAYEHEVQ